MKTSDFDYLLPPHLIAQIPIEPRDHSRLMVLSREDRSIEHRHFYDIIDYLEKGDVLVCNDSRVIPARLFGQKKDTGGKVEILLLRRLDGETWETLVKPGRRIGIGTRIKIGDEEASMDGEVLDRSEDGVWHIRFSNEAELERLGLVPLPPYIHMPLQDPERYQTVYARIKGSVAAPTAGLHFTPALMQRLGDKGVEFAFVTLHVGLDSFRPVKVDDPREHHLHLEYCELGQETIDRLDEARRSGKRIMPVGTTCIRLLEAAVGKGENGSLKPFSDWTDLMILPGHKFQMVDALITNFHLPRSTLLMLVSAFAGREFILHAYQMAIQEKYRFYSFGDAMLIL